MPDACYKAGTNRSTRLIKHCYDCQHTMFSWKAVHRKQHFQGTLSVSNFSSPAPACKEKETRSVNKPHMQPKQR